MILDLARERCRLVEQWIHLEWTKLSNIDGSLLKVLVVIAA